MSVPSVARVKIGKMTKNVVVPVKRQKPTNLGYAETVLWANTRPHRQHRARIVAWEGLRIADAPAANCALADSITIRPAALAAHVPRGVYRTPIDTLAMSA